MAVGGGGGVAGGRLPRDTSLLSSGGRLIVPVFVRGEKTGHLRAESCLWFHFLYWRKINILKGHCVVLEIQQESQAQAFNVYNIIS